MLFDCFGLRRKKRSHSADHGTVLSSATPPPEVHAPQPVHAVASSAAAAPIDSALLSVSSDTRMLETQQTFVSQDATNEISASESCVSGHSAPVSEEAPRAIAGLQPTPLAMLFHSHPARPVISECDSGSAASERVVESEPSADLRPDVPLDCILSGRNESQPSEACGAVDEQETTPMSLHENPSVVNASSDINPVLNGEQPECATVTITDIQNGAQTVEPKDIAPIRSTHSRGDNVDSDAAKVSCSADCAAPDTAASTDQLESSATSIPVCDSPAPLAPSAQPMPESQPAVTLAPRAGTRLASAKAAASVRLATGVPMASEHGDANGVAEASSIDASSNTASELKSATPRKSDYTTLAVSADLPSIVATTDTDQFDPARHDPSSDGDEACDAKSQRTGDTRPGPVPVGPLNMTGQAREIPQKDADIAPSDPATTISSIEDTNEGVAATSDTAALAKTPSLVLKPEAPIASGSKKTHSALPTTSSSKSPAKTGPPNTFKSKMSVFQQLIDSSNTAEPAPVSVPKPRKWSVADDEAYERNLGHRASSVQEDAGDGATVNDEPESSSAVDGTVPTVPPRPDVPNATGTEDEFETAEEGDDRASIHSADVFSDAANDEAAIQPADEPGPSPLRHGLRPIFAAGAEHSDELRRALARRAGAPTD